MSYFNIDDILSDTRRIPCTFAVNARGLAELDTSGDNTRTSLPSGSNVDLPVWLAMGIMERSERNRRRLLLPHLPTMLLTSRRINLQANATGVNLHAIDPHFYNLAIRLIQLFTIVGRVAVHFNNPFPSHAAELRDFIRYMLHRRFALSLIPRAPEHIARLGPVSTTEFAEALDTLERSIYSKKERAYAESLTWRQGRLHTLSACPLVTKETSSRTKRTYSELK